MTIDTNTAPPTRQMLAATVWTAKDMVALHDAFKDAVNHRDLVRQGYSRNMHVSFRAQVTAEGGRPVVRLHFAPKATITSTTPGFIGVGAFDSHEDKDGIMQAVLDAINHALDEAARVAPYHAMRGQLGGLDRLVVESLGSYRRQNEAYLGQLYENAN